MDISNKEICYELLRECRVMASKDLDSLSSSLASLRDHLSAAAAALALQEEEEEEEERVLFAVKEGNTIDGPFHQKDNDDEDSVVPRQEFATLLLQLDIVRTGSSSFESRLQDQLDECLDLCGYQASFLAAVEILKQEKGKFEEAKQRQYNTNRTLLDATNAPSLSSIVSCLHTIGRYLFYRTTTTTTTTIDLDNTGTGTGSANGTDKGVAGLPLCYKLLEECLKPWMVQVHCTDSMEDRNRRRLEGTRAFVNFITLLPNQIANACLRNKMELPSWCIRNKFLSRIVESAATMAWMSHYYLQPLEEYRVGGENDKGEESMVMCKVMGEDYLYVLVEKCLQVGSMECASVGMYRFWLHVTTRFRDEHGLDCSVVVLVKVLKRIASPRQNALLLYSTLKYIVSQLEMYHADMSWKELDRVCREQCLPFVMRLWLSILQSSSMVRDKFVEKAILAPSPSADVSEQKLLARCVVLLLAFCLDGCGTDDDDDDDDDSEDGITEKEFKSDIAVQNKVLMKHLAQVAMVWSESSFVNKTDVAQQRHVTFFILYAIEFMTKESSSVFQQVVVEELLPGVSNRLKVSERSLRIDGMQVAEHLAPILGQTLKFEELDGIREERDENGTKMENENKMVPQQDSVKVATSKSKKGRVMRKSRVKADIDPDEEYHSEDEDDFSENSSRSDDDNHSVYSSDSEWDEDGLVSLKLRDEEEDLRVVPRPKYLRECLDLLRADGDDQVAVCKQEAALSELPGLIRALPPDLSDVASSLADELLFKENKFNLSDFSELRWQGLTALGACDPVSTIEYLQSQMFSTNMSLGTRFDILDVMKHSAYELSGQAEMDKSCKPIEPEKFIVKVAGKRSLVPDEYLRKLEGAVETTVNSEIKTRRWGKGRRTIDKHRSVINRFGPLSSLFFYPLIQGFLQSREDEILWGGESGGMVLSHFIVTLAAFVEFSGNHPGTAVLAKDLIELSWPLFGAVNAEVRQAVLIAVSTSLPYLPIEYIYSICAGEMQMINTMQAITNFDTSEKCRLLASVLLNGFRNALLPYS